MSSKKIVVRVKKTPPAPLVEEAAEVVADIKKRKATQKKSPPRHSLSPEVQELVRQGYEQGLSQYRIAKNLGIHQTRVSVLAREKGWKFAAQASHLAEARRAHADLDRQNMKSDMIALIKKSVERLAGEDYVLVSAGPHKTRVDTVPHPPGFEMHQYTGAMRDLLACVEKLEELERGKENDLAAVDQFLEKIVEDED